MKIFSQLHGYFQKTWLLITLFWGFVFLLNTGPHWEIYASNIELFENVGVTTALQMFLALITIQILIPFVLNRGHKLWFFIGLIFLVFITSEINVVIRYFYLEPQYPVFYQNFLRLYGEMPFADRMLSLWTLKYIFFSKLPLFLSPCMVLVAYNFHKKQQDLLLLNEQKRKAELAALKNQLNPHFIFNTLNNLYALALKKSDQTPLVIEKLSDILDYVLYRCNDKFVSLNNEIALIHNYMDLEKLRFGKRIVFTTDVQVDHDVRIAPLILLTLLENACKHGSSQELKQAHVKIAINASITHIDLMIENSKPIGQISIKQQPEKIGLQNLRKQLQLLYKKSHKLSVQETDEHYKVTLTLNIR